MIDTYTMLISELEDHYELPDPHVDSCGCGWGGPSFNMHLADVITERFDVTPR